MNALKDFWDFDDRIKCSRYLLVSCALFLFAYSFMKISLYDYFKYIEPLFVLSCLYVFYRYSGFEKKTFPVLMLYYSIFVTLAVWFFGYLNHPDLIRSSPKVEHLARHFIFIVMAFIIAGSERNAGYFLLAAVIGLMLSPWTHGGGWSEIVSGFNGSRITFGIQNWQHTGVLFGVSLLGLLVFFQRIVFMPAFSVYRLVLWFLLFSFCVYTVIASQTRAVFLALALIFFIVFIFFVFLYFIRLVKSRSGFFSGKLTYIYFSIFLSALIVVFSLYKVGVFDKTYSRFSSEFFVVNSLLEGDFDSIPINSLGARIHSWRAASEWFLERPVMGWGSNGGIIVMRHTDWLKGSQISSFGHLHSSYIETAIRYGLLGVSIYFMLSIWVARKAWLAWKSNFIPNDFFVFFVLFFVFWVVVNFFESYMYYWTGVYVFNIVMAVLVSFLWRYMRFSESGPLR